VRFDGLVPAGAIPRASAVRGAAGRHVVANNTGVSAPGSPTVGDNVGSVSIVPIPRRGDEIPLDELNPGSTTPMQRAWTRASAAMGFADPNSVPDENAENVLNRAIWYATKGFDRPYPGDRKVLRPQDVPR
jgi:hypothetical protein